VPSARRIWAVQAAVAAGGVFATIAAVWVAVSRVDFGIPSLAELAAACQRYALAQMRPASLLVLAIGSVGLATMVLTARAVVRQLRAGWQLERNLQRLGSLPGAVSVHVIDEDFPHAFCMVCFVRASMSRGQRWRSWATRSARQSSHTRPITRAAEIPCACSWRGRSPRGSSSCRRCGA
jgi:hypothetical protein